MKHNWQYKKLGEVCEVLYGYPFDSSYFNTDGQGMPLIRIRDVKPGKTSTFYSDSNYSNEYIIKKGDYLIGMDGEFNISPWKSDEALLNQRVCKISSKDSLFTHYLFYFLILELKKIEDKTPFVTVKHLSDKVLKSIKVPIPNVSIQEIIVNELDEINGMIEGRKEQIKLLDQLAQSIFYEMFGDPITNPKGWEICKLGYKNEVSSSKRVLIQDVVESGIPFIRGTELAELSKQSSFDPSIFTLFITEEHYEKVKKITGVPIMGDLLIPSINPDGFIWEVNTPSSFYFKDGRVLWVHVNKDVYSSKWLRFALSKLISEKYKSLSRGAVFAELTLIFLRNLIIPVPPIKLQEEFASKVELIEEQKHDIENSIKELETLLASRMDYWFN